MRKSILDQIRDRQAEERARPAALERAYGKSVKPAERRQFAREASEIISIMRQRSVAPRMVVAYDHRKGQYLGPIGNGWLITGDDNSWSHGVVKIALMEGGYCLPCEETNPYSDKRIPETALVVSADEFRRDTWCMTVDLVAQVRGLIGE